MSENARRDDERVLTLSRHPVETKQLSPTEQREADDAKFEASKRRSYLKVLRSIKRTGWFWPGE